MKDFISRAETDDYLNYKLSILIIVNKNSETFHSMFRKDQDDVLKCSFCSKPKEIQFTVTEEE